MPDPRECVPDADETGASSVEYALLVTAVAAAIVLVIMAVGGLVTTMFGESCDTIKTAASSSVACD